MAGQSEVATKKPVSDLAVSMYGVMRAMDAGGESDPNLRIALALLNSENDWTMADVAQAHLVRQAAQDLLEALGAIVADADDMTREDAVVKKALIDNARAAIAKAQGGAA